MAKLRTRADVIQNQYSQFNDSVMQSLNMITRAQESKSRREDEKERYADEKEFRVRSANVDVIKGAMPSVLLKPEFQNWATDDEVYDNLLGYTNDMKTSIDAGKNFNASGSFMGADADESINFGYDPTSKITEEDVSTYRSWLFGTGQASQTFGLTGIVDTGEAELSESERLDLIEKGLIKVDKNSATGYESWDSVRENAGLITDRFDMFVSGFKSADGGQKFYTDDEMLTVQNTMTANQQNMAHLIKSDPKYVRSSNIVTTFDSGELETRHAIIDGDEHKGYSFYSERDGEVISISGGDTQALNLEELRNEGYVNIALALQSSSEDLARYAENPAFLEGLRSESNPIYTNVIKAIESVSIRNSYERQLDVSSLDVFKTQTQRAQLADVNLLVAEKVNFEIDKLFEELGSNPNTWRSNFDTQEAFEMNSPSMTKLFDDVYALGQRLTDPTSVTYNENVAKFVEFNNGDLTAWLETLLINRSQKEGKEHYFNPNETYGDKTSLYNAGGI